MGLQINIYCQFRNHNYNNIFVDVHRAMILISMLTVFFSRVWKHRGGERDCAIGY